MSRGAHTKIRDGPERNEANEHSIFHKPDSSVSFTETVSVMELKQNPHVRSIQQRRTSALI